MVVKAQAQEMGCLDVFVIHAIKIVQADVIQQFIVPMTLKLSS